MSIKILQASLAKGIGDVALKKYLNYIKNNNTNIDYIDDVEILFKLGFKKDTIDSFILNRSRAEDIYYKLCDQNIEIITEISNEYPQYLKAMLKEKCPPLLFVKGNKELLNSDAVGFCGSRDVSRKGMSIAENCSKQLVDKEITIVSGYASGTDLTAHKAALENGGNTIFVLAEGILKYSNKRVVAELLTNENHLFVSQFMPEITWNAGNAMKRNSIIIGLSKAMILVESKLKGGTFEAGKESLRVGCPLFVIDYAQPEVSAEANPFFINSGGYPIKGKNGIPNMINVLSIIKNDIRIKKNEEIEQLRIE